MCRETYEWNEDHIPYATYTGRGNLERDIVSAIRIIDTKEGIVPNVNDEIVLYCAGGFRSLVAADTLIKMGYKNVKSLNGGTSSSS
jgi:rhodanese-related sulfurtransferase